MCERLPHIPQLPQGGNIGLNIFHADVQWNLSFREQVLHIHKVQSKDFAHATNRDFFRLVLTKRLLDELKLFCRCHTLSFPIMIPWAIMPCQGM